MPRIAIVAFGSLIEDPGDEICPLLTDRINGVRTPFSIEFARSSSTRDGAPTLIPVDVGGAPVNAVLLVLDATIDLGEAKSLLWRRETRREFSGKRYARPANPGPKHVLVESIQDFRGFDRALYTKIDPNIAELNADYLADLSIHSAQTKAGADGKDGISYLASVIRQGIATPLLPAYRASILRKTDTTDLKEAHSRIRKGLA